MIASLFDFDHCLAYVTAVLLIGLFVLLFYNLVCIYREYEVRGVSDSQNARLGLVLQTGCLRLWIYAPLQRRYYFLSDTGDYAEDYNEVEFSRLYNRDDFEHLSSAVIDISQGKCLSADVSLRSAAPDDETCSRFEVSVSVASRDDRGRVRQILGIEHDVTDDYQKKQSVSQLLIRYHTVFNSSLIDMLYYDKDGYLRDINDTACQAFGITDRQHFLDKGFRLSDNPFFSTSDVNQLEITYSSSIVDYDRSQSERLRQLGLHGKMFYESVVNPIRNADGELEGVYMAGRTVTEMVESYYRQQEGAKRLRKVNQDIRDYVNNINYALQVSDVRMVNYYPDSFMLEISGDVNHAQLRLSQVRCIRLGTPEYRRNISILLNRMDHRSRHAIAETIQLGIRDKKGRNVWLMFNMVPVFDAEGHVERYFGMCRNMTDIVETEQRLAVETKKAQETELLKQSFLTNMSHEIRTPLNTVVGFAELFEADHDVSDEPIFVEEIKKNSNTLLRLINDILFLSRLDAHMIEYSYSFVDFALLFESHCQMGWSGVNPNVKTIVENPYQHLVLNIDQGNLGQVIEKLCNNAAVYTQEGFIRAYYVYRRGELIIQIEDSSGGIDKETLPHVFDRFVRERSDQQRGTGLDLAIVQELVQQMGGSIEFQSELGKGNTVWVILPCEMQTLEKQEIIV